MADKKMRYTTVVGPLPILTDPSTWAPAWAREEARPDVEDTLAHATFRGSDPARPANPFAKQIVAMPHALVPSLDDRASSITIVRRSREVEYRRLYLGFLDDAPADPPLVPTFDYILTPPPFIDVSDSEGPTTAQLTTARNHRGGLTGHLLGWHKTEYSSCTTATRSRFYLPPPAWWSGVEVPYGCMAEFPWVHTYASDDLHAGRRTPWVIFRSEWALEAAVVLLETFRTGRDLWLYPPRILDWIRALGPANICVGLGGPDAEATAILGALLDLADQLPDTEAFRQRLRARKTDRRDREGWVWAGLEMENHEACAKVAADLRPFDLPHTADILAARSYGDTRGGWAAAVSTARSPRYPGGGTEPPASSAVTRAAGSSPAGPLSSAPATSPSVGNSLGNRIVSVDPLEHRDISNAAFDQLDHVPSDRVPQGLARVVHCDPGELRGYTTGTLIAGLCHTVVSLGDSIAQWALDNAGIPPQQVEELLQLVGRRNARAVLLRETSVAAGGVSRGQQHLRDRNVYHEEPPAQRSEVRPATRAVCFCRGVGEPGGLARGEVGNLPTRTVVVDRSVEG